MLVFHSIISILKVKRVLRIIPIRSSIIWKFICFAGVGAGGTLVQYATLFILVRLHIANAIAASAIGFILGAIVNYYLNYRYIFTSSKRHRDAMTKFLVVALAGLAINVAVLSFIMSNFHLHYFVSQVISTGFVLFFNFTGNYIWTFREKTNE